MDHYDVVIVGAGSAGCALAARLTENPDRSVLLLEAGSDFAGPVEFPADLLDASAMAGAAGGHAANWSLDARLTRSRTTSVPRGKVIGGSSTVNGGVFVRAAASDFERWAAMGNDAWAFAEVLPYFIRLENDHDFAGADYHGDAGPVPVARIATGQQHELSRAFVRACTELGFAQAPDKNAPGSAGVGALPLNVVDGVRVNAAMAYIAPNRSRPNLRIESGVAARRVLFAGNRAVAVEAERRGEVERFVGDQIVLCAGAVMSPKLLLLSGVGPADRLRRLGIAVLADHPGVGTQCRDHPQLFVALEATRPLPRRRGSGVVEVGLDATIDGVPVAAMPYLASMAELVPGSGARPDELVIGMLLERSESDVQIALTSSDPSVPPSIDYHALESAHDRSRLQALAQLGMAIADSQAMNALGLRRSSPSRAADLDQWVHDNVTTAIHLCSGAPMGPATDPLAVVDQHCRVHGIDGLRVVDTSVLPTAPSRGPACTAIMIGERASAFFEV